MDKIHVCPYRGLPCDSTYPSKSDYLPCFIKDRGKTVYVCAWVRFKGKNSVEDRGLGMTIYEKLKRQGLISQ
jgi:hypothetical protein